MELFWIECRKILKSLIYYVFIGILVLFYTSQMGTTDMKSLKEYSSPPKKVDVDEYYSKNHNFPYGTKYGGITKEVMPTIINNLYREYKENEYRTYPYGFEKNVKLSKDKAKEIEKALTEITGESISKLDEIYASTDVNVKFPVSSLVTVDSFSKSMEDIDKLLGGGSSYSKKRINILTSEPVTYEEAVKNYEYLSNKDKFTNGYARIFCDYMGVMLGILPIFITVLMSMKDKQSKMQELIYSRNASSAKIVLARYFALVFMMLLPVFIISLEPLTAFIRLSLHTKTTIDIFAFAKYILWWLLPTLMFVTAVGLILTTLTDTAIAIAVQLFIWFMSVNSMELTGDYPILSLLIRHNNSQMGVLIEQNAMIITANRIIISAIALILIAVTIYIFELKRRGRFDINSEIRKLFKFNSSKSKA